MKILADYWLLVATSTTTTATARTTSSASTTSTVGFRTSLVDVNDASLQFLAVHFSDCRLGFILRGYFYKTKSS